MGPYGFPGPNAQNRGSVIASPDETDECWEVLEENLAMNGVNALRAKKLVCATCGHLKEDHCGADATDFLDRYHLPADMHDLLEDHVHCVGFFNNECAPQIVHPDTGKTHTVGTWRDINAAGTLRIEQPYMTGFIRELYDRLYGNNPDAWPPLDDPLVTRHSSRSTVVMMERLLKAARGRSYHVTSTLSAWVGNLTKAYIPQAEWFVKHHTTTPHGLHIKTWLLSHNQSASSYIKTHAHLLGQRMHLSAAFCSCMEFREQPYPVPEDGESITLQHIGQED